MKSLGAESENEVFIDFDMFLGVYMARFLGRTVCMPRETCGMVATRK
jgi:hypothetical protein